MKEENGKVVGICKVENGDISEYVSNVMIFPNNSEEYSELGDYLIKIDFATYYFTERFVDDFLKSSSEYFVLNYGIGIKVKRDDLKPIIERAWNLKELIFDA